jgi:hypothetical protein
MLLLEMGEECKRKVELINRKSPLASMQEIKNTLNETARDRPFRNLFRLDNEFIRLELIIPNKHAILFWGIFPSLLRGGLE